MKKILWSITESIKFDVLTIVKVRFDFIGVEAIKAFRVRYCIILKVMNKSMGPCFRQMEFDFYPVT
jgi:hypothetical protein